MVRGLDTSLSHDAARALPGWRAMNGEGRVGRSGIVGWGDHRTRYLSTAFGTYN